MFTTREFLFPTVCPFSPSAAEMAQQRRRELTDLFLTQKYYFLRIANLILQNEADAEDVIHNSFCAAWKSIATFRGDSAMKTWFSRIVTNHAIVFLRKKKARQLVSIEENAEYFQAVDQTFKPVVGNPEKIVMRQEMLRVAIKQIRFLPIETRIVFRLHFCDERSVAEIAKMRGKSALAVTAHLQRGKAILRRRVRKVPAQRIALQRQRTASP